MVNEPNTIEFDLKGVPRTLNEDGLKKLFAGYSRIINLMWR